MKNLIITTAMAVLIITMLTWQLQLGKTLRERGELKELSQEAAASAALCIDERQFGEGFLRFDRREASAKAEEIIKQNFTGDPDKLYWEISFADEGERPSVTVSITWEKLRTESVYEYLPL